VISSLLANIYLHYVLDTWFAEVVKPRLRGEAYEIRYADDFILCFQYGKTVGWSVFEQILGRFPLLPPRIMQPWSPAGSRV
jgi:hypothetical protein